MSHKESPETYHARKKIKQIFWRNNFRIDEFVQLPDVTNNMGEEIWPPYEADMILAKVFIIEFDSKKIHGTKIRRVKDKWRDINILNQKEIPTVRLISKDVNKDDEDLIMKEIESQLDGQIQQ